MALPSWKVMPGMSAIFQQQTFRQFQTHPSPPFFIPPRNLYLHIFVKLQITHTMELGIGMFGDNHYDEHGKPLPAGERLRELIEEIKLMDETGIEFFGIGEH